MDARISDVVITLDKRWEDDLSGALQILKDAGVAVTSADDDTSVVEGSIDVCRVHDLEKLDCVEYVRMIFTYYANYPPGDPRDRDGV